MSIIVVSRWKGSRENVVSNARKAKAIALKHGAEDMQVAQIFTGPNTGQWLVTTRFKSLEAMGALQPKIHSDPKFQAVMKAAMNTGEMLERSILLVEDL